MILGIGIAVIILAIAVALVVIEATDSLGGGIATGVIGLFVGIILIVVHFLGTESGGRALKNISSDFSGLERTMQVYDMTGNLLKTYEGKFDINNNEQGVIKFDLNGKRHLIYNAIVIVDEK